MDEELQKLIQKMGCEYDFKEQLESDPGKVSIVVGEQEHRSSTYEGNRTQGQFRRCGAR